MVINLASDSLPDLPDSKVRSYVPVTDPELVESFIDPIRRAILVALRYGTERVKEDISFEEITRKDGTKVKTTIVEEKKTQRFWLTVPEIVANVEQYLPEIEVSKYNCYYHLPKLVEQGLVEEFSAREEGDSRSKRGVYYRRTAKVFVVIDSKMSGDAVKTYLKLFTEGLELSLNQKALAHLEDLMIRQIEMVDEAMEYLAMHLKEVDVESTALSDLLQGLAYIYLSDNPEFVEIQKDIKGIVLTPCCGPTPNMDSICSYCGDPISPGSIVFRKVDNKNQSFCSEECANSYVQECKT
jgi:DNA-binding transcriptional ArsR family regulator